LQLAVASEGEVGGESKEARNRRRRAEGKGAAALSGEVRDFPFPLLRFIGLREPRSPNCVHRAH
jgi:hypothetical protein